MSSDQHMSRMQMGHPHQYSLHRRKMTTFFVASIPNQIPSSSYPVPRNRGEFLRMPRITKWFLDGPLRVIVEERRVRAKELSVREDCTRKGICEPIESHTIQDVVNRGTLIGPLEKPAAVNMQDLHGTIG